MLEKGALLESKRAYLHVLETRFFQNGSLLGFCYGYDGKFMFIDCVFDQ